LAAFANGLSWIVLIPIWQYPDEQSHFAQVQGIAELGGIPETGYDTSAEVAISETLLGTERDTSGNNRFTYNPYYHIDYTAKGNGLYEDFISNLPIETRSQYVKREATHNPPLYHIMASNFYNIFSQHSLFARVYAVRIFSVLLYLCLIVFSINFSKMAFKNDKGAQVCFPALIAFAPMLVFSTTGVLPDPLTILLFSVILTVGLKIITYRLNLILLFLPIVMLVLGIFTRQQFQVAFPAAVLPVIYSLSKRLSRKTVVIAYSLLAIIALALAIISFWQSKFMFDIPEIGKANPRLLFSANFAQYFISTLKRYYSQTLPWYWGVYKWLSLTIPHIYYQIINRIILASLLGLLIRTFFLLKERKLQKVDLIIPYLILSSAIYFIVFAVWDFYFQRSYHYSFGIQGRYLLTHFFSKTVVFIFGLREIFIRFLKKYLPVLYFLLALAMVLFNDISLSFVASTYYGASDFKMLISQISQYKPVILKGNVIVVIVLLALFFQVLYLLKLVRHLKTNYESS
jgi:hypothetical protein